MTWQRFSIGSALIGVLALAPVPMAVAADPAGDLADARARWQSRAVEDYSYRVQTQCGACIGDRGKAKTVRVVAGKPQTLPAHFRAYDTVDELFALVERELANAASVRVTYAANTGVPTSISVDQLRNSIDDEYSVRITQIRAPR